MIDPFGRTIAYLRVSVTDHCDFRCMYCMDEDMAFLPKSEVLTLEELDRVCSAFVGRGVRKIRLTGGEPLVRRNVIELIRSLGRHLETGALDELALTTNGNRLARHAAELADAGVRRVNVSLDTLDPGTYSAITRRGDLAHVLEGISAAEAAGLAVKINAVALRGVNEGHGDDLLKWCGARGFDLTFIEAMPMGDNDNYRDDRHMPLAEVRAGLERSWTLTDVPDSTGGPARYARVAETGTRVGFITPMSHGFCDACNRVRLTCTGRLYMCLGQDDHVDLRAPVRESEGDAALLAAIDGAIGRKPKGHEFQLGAETRAVAGRAMNVTGG